MLFIQEISIVACFILTQKHKNENIYTTNYTTSSFESKCFY